MTPDQAGQGQVHKPVLVLKDQVAVFFDDVPVLTLNVQRGVQTGGAVFDDLQRPFVLRTDDAGNAGFQNTRLFACNSLDRVAQKGLVIH